MGSFRYSLVSVLWHAINHSNMTSHNLVDFSVLAFAEGFIYMVLHWHWDQKDFNRGGLKEQVVLSLTMGSFKFSLMSVLWPAINHSNTQTHNFSSKPEQGENIHLQLLSWPHLHPWWCPPDFCSTGIPGCDRLHTPACTPGNHGARCTKPNGWIGHKVGESVNASQLNLNQTDSGPNFRQTHLQSRSA